MIIIVFIIVCATGIRETARDGELAINRRHGQLQRVLLRYVLLRLSTLRVLLRAFQSVPGDDDGKHGKVTADPSGYA